ncbi:MAG: hypothetical protein IPM64_01355 [Phycisphaerales bacterium]|nr:hypothetical protein [Phycisphaerales bacterium]
MNRLSARLAMLLLAAAALVSPARADLKKLLAAVPDDAEAALLILNVNDLASGVSAFGKGAKITDWAGFTGPSLLAAIDFPYPTDGLDLAAGLVIYAREGDDEPAAILFPSDMAAWKRTVVAEDAADGLFKLGGDVAGWGALRDGRIIVAEEKERVSGAKFTGKFAEKAGSLAALERSQIIAVADVAAWRESVRGSFELLGTLIEMSMAAEAGADEDDIAALKQIGKIVSEGALQALDDCDRVAIGVRFGGEAARCAVVAGFQGSTAREVGKLKAADRDILRGLPGGPALMVAAFETVEPMPSGSMWERLLGEFIKSGLKTQSAESVGKVEDAMKAWAKFSAQTTGTSVAVIPAGDRLAVISQHFSPNPAESARQIEEYNRLSSRLSRDMSGATIEESSEEVAGRRTAISTITFEDGSEEAAMISAVYGNPMFVAVAETPVGVGVAMGSGAAARRGIKDMIELKADAGLSTSTLGETLRRNLPPRPLAAVLLDVTEFARATMRIVQVMGLPVPNVRFGPSGPIAIGLYAEQGVLSLEVHVPTSAVRSISEAMERLMGEEEDTPIEQ